MAPPWIRRAGVLHLERTDLRELARAREGRPARLTSHAALAADLARMAAAGAALPLSAAESPEVLALAATAGLRVSVTSRHELELVLAAGFGPAAIVARAPVAEDGFLLDAIVAQVGVLVAGDATVSASAQRIAAGLRLPLPCATGAPPDWSAPLARRAGGLLAVVLREAPALVLDAAWTPAARGRADVLLLHDVEAGNRLLADSAREGTLATLSTAPPCRARLPEGLRRGDWVCVRDGAPLALRPPDPAHSLPPDLLVRGAHWRPLAPRRWPAPAE